MWLIRTKRMRTQEKTQKRLLSALQLRNLQQATQKCEPGLWAKPYCQRAERNVMHCNNSNARTDMTPPKLSPRESETEVGSMEGGDCQVYLAVVFQRVATMS